MKEKTITIGILVALVIITIIISVPLIIKNNNENNKKYFPEYDEIKITNKIISNSYEEARKSLEKSYYFNRLSIIPDYNKEEYKPEMLQSLLWYFIYNYQLSNTRYFSYYEKENGKYCFQKNSLIGAFKELYGIDISKQYDYLKGYYKYVYESNKGYCLDFKKVNSEYTNNIKISIKDISKHKDVITVEMYVYEYKAKTENEKYYEKLLIESIDNKNYNNSYNIVISNLKGSVKRKELKFEQDRNGKFFKYKILSSKELN